MPDPSPAELRGLLVDATFGSEAFTVSKGEKTPWMLEVEAGKNASAAKARADAGLPASGPKTYPPPNPATKDILAKLASVLKYFIREDIALEAITKFRFRAHFANVLTAGVLVLDPICDATFDAALPADVTYKELRGLGMHRGGEPLGIESLGKWVKSKTFGMCMPTGEIADNFLVLKKLLVLDPELAGGKLEWNEMDCAITVDRQRIEDNVTTGDIRIRMGEVYFVPNTGKRGMRSFVPSDAYVQQAIENIARKNRYHEAREELQSLRGTWDNTPRFLQLLKAIGGYKEEKGTVEEIAWIHQINNLALSQLIKTFIGTVARTFSPGCQMDTMLVLKSKQGTKKSSLFRALAPANRFSDAHLEFGNKDSLMAMQQNCWYECAELSGMLKKEIQIVKGFITSRSDDFRLPYGKAITKNPRHCVLVGTTNDDTPLRDATGSRRFWIIIIDDAQKTNMELVVQLKPQLWAEAVAMYDAKATCVDCQTSVDGEVRCTAHRWWLTIAEDQLREKFNEQFTEAEPYIQWLKDWILNNTADKNTTRQGLHAAYKSTDALRVNELLSAAGLAPKECHDAGQQRRMVNALKSCGYALRHTRSGNLWISPGMQGRTLVLVPPLQNIGEATKEEDAEEILVASSDSPETVE